MGAVRPSHRLDVPFQGVSVTQTYNLEKKVDSCDITVTYWADRKKLVVPFKLVLGLGFYSGVARFPEKPVLERGVEPIR